MNKKIISYIIGILGCIIIDAGLVAMVVAFGTSRPFYDYIFFGVLAILADFLFLALVGVCFEKPENKCLVIKLPCTVDDDSLPKLKYKQKTWIVNTEKGVLNNTPFFFYLYGLLPILWFLIHQVMLIYVSLGFLVCIKLYFADTCTGNEVLLTEPRYVD